MFSKSLLSSAYIAFYRISTGIHSIPMGGHGIGQAGEGDDQTSILERRVVRLGEAGGRGTGQGATAVVPVRDDEPEQSQ